MEGLKSPSMPGWPLNSATDEMLKNEFDIHRKNQTQHPEMKKNNSLKNDMFDLAEKLWPINRSITGEGIRESLRIIKNLLPKLKIYS